MKRKPLNPKLPAPYADLCAEDLDAATVKFDRELIVEASRPLQAKLKKARRGASARSGMLLL